MRNFSRLVGAALLATLPTLAWAETIKIGGIFPMSGPGAAWGSAGAAAMKYAIEEANAAGGLRVGGKTYDLQLVVYDDQFKASEALSAYHRLRDEDEAHFVFDMPSASHMAIKSVAEGDDVFVLTSAITTKAIDRNSTNIVKIDSAPRDYVPPLVKWLKAHIGGAKVALLYPNDESGWEFTELSKKEFAANGYQVVNSELADRSLKDFQPILTRLMANSPDMIDIGPTPAAVGGLIARQARELGFKGAIVNMGGTSSAQLLAAAGPAAAEGLVHMIYVNPSSEGFKRISKRYQDEVGQSPNELIVSFYDATKALIKAMSLSEDPADPANVREAFPKAFPLLSLEGQELTFGGKEHFGFDAQMMTAKYIATFKDGKAEVVGVAK